MKKYLTMALTTLMIAATTVCFAANGKLLDAEESIAEQYAGGGLYKKLAPLMASEMQANMTEANYNDMQKQMAEALGKINVFKMRGYNRFDDADVLTYQLSTEKVPVAQFKFVFKINADKPLLFDAFLEVPKPKQEENAKK